VGEFAIGDERKELLRGPEGDGGGSGAGALEADFAEVELVGGEVGVGRVVLVEASDGGVAKEDAAAAVGLEAMLWGSMTMESAWSMASKARRAGSASWSAMRRK